MGRELRDAIKTLMAYAVHAQKGSDGRGHDLKWTDAEREAYAVLERATRGTLPGDREPEAVRS